MIRNTLILVASFGLMAGCATSSATSTPQNPDAGKVNYDVGSAPNGGTGSGSGGTEPATDGGAAPHTAKGRDSTSTKSVGLKPKVVKKIAAAKPPKPEEPAADPKAKPTRKGRVDVNGLLAEAFAIEATTTKLPDLTTFAGPSSIFIAATVDATGSTPLAGIPATVATPTALRFTGTINITAGDEYKLCTKSSDGSQLLIEDTLVVDNDGVHAEAVEVCELVNLEPGEYKIEIRSFHTKSVLVQASWAVGKDGTPAAIPTRSFFRPADADARVKAKK
ncbi:MAG: hypothetical protein IPO88_09825 [Nannocystis sp.]|uniref:PA14 domain-containing protein n=1 Tax=Nannocystis sp. TaxID=1962667 RepID=UPI0024233B88|nr:PA14 domain-containing protein [Nannocystis sp.]MBK9753785.1 hypothetical protein [Nannocystis sp.]